MAEEQGRAGDKGEERVVALFDSLGWTLRGDTNIDIENDYKYHTERGSTYGVDGYMTYDGPYREKERGFIIESKNVKWDSYGPKKFKKWANETLQKVEAVPEAEDFDKYLNFGTPRIVNAGILSIWTSDADNYNHETFQGYLEEVPVRPKKRRKFQILILGNRELTRLASIHSTFQSIWHEEATNSVEFFHPPRNDSHSARSKLLTLEYLLSDYIFARAEVEQSLSPVSVTQDIGIIFYFDTLKIEALNFMYRAVLEHGMDDVDKLRVYLYDDHNDDIQLESVKREFMENGLQKELSGEGPEIDIKTLNRVNYTDYTDRLQEDQ